MYKDELGSIIKELRKEVFGYSQRRLAKMLNEDIETIRMIEDGRIKNPRPQLILNLATIFDTYYMKFVNKDYEDEFLTYLEWDTQDELIIEIYKSACIEISNAFIKMGKKNID